MGFTLLDDSGGIFAGLGIISILFFVLTIAVAVFYIYCYWRIFVKAGQQGWLAIIPIVNTVFLLIISGLSPWMILLVLIPGVGGLILAIMLCLSLAKVFGKGGGFAVGLIFLPEIFIPILAFDKSKYLPPSPQVVMAVPAQQYVPPQYQPQSQQYAPPYQPQSQPYPPQSQPSQYPSQPQQYPPQQYPPRS